MKQKPVETESLYLINQHGEAELVRYAGGPDAVVPDQWQGAPLTAVRARAFSDIRITSVHLPDTLVRIGEEAFSGCTALREINLPLSLREIKAGAFLRCSSLTAFTAAEHHPVYRCEDGILYDRRGRVLLCCPAGKLDTEIHVPLGVNGIAEYAFAWCVGPRSVILPRGVSEISEGAFSMCTSLLQIVLPQGLQRIGERAFMGCGKLEQVIIPPSVLSIGEEAFTGCENLRSVLLPDTLDRVENGLFSDCRRLDELNLPESVRFVGDDAFRNCASLTQLNLPITLDWLGSSAFRSCSSLREIELPENLRHVGAHAFDGCERLTLTVYTGSAGEAMAKEHKIRYRTAGGRVFGRLRGRNQQG